MKKLLAVTSILLLTCSCENISNQSISNSASRTGASRKGAGGHSSSSGSGDLGRFFSARDRDSGSSASVNRPSYPRWPAAYDRVVASHISNLSLINLDGSKTMGLCPNLHNLKPRDKSEFFQAAFMGLASAESGYSKYSGPKTGIMQLTCDNNARTHYNCPCKSRTHLRDDSALNIRCAMNIIDYQYRKGLPIWSSNRYFETLRNNGHRTKIFNAIKSRLPADCHKKGKSFI